MADGHGHDSHSSASPSLSGAQQRAAVFVTIIAAAIALGYGGLVLLKLNPIVWAGILVLLAAVIWLSPRVIEFREYERGVFFRFGRFSKVGGPGAVLFYPRIESFVRADLRDTPLDIPPQSVITLDNITLTIDTVCEVRITDPKLMVLTVREFQKSLVNSLAAELRNTISQMTLADVLDHADDVSARLITAISPRAAEWGITIRRVEIEKVTLPDELRAAMNARKEAEERKLRLETDAQARTVVLDSLNLSASKLTPTTLEYLYLDTLKRMADGRATKIVLPAELSRLAEVIGGRIGRRPNPGLFGLEE